MESWKLKSNPGRYAKINKLRSKLNLLILKFSIAQRFNFHIGTTPFCQVALSAFERSSLFIWCVVFFLWNQILEHLELHFSRIFSAHFFLGVIEIIPDYVCFLRKWSNDDRNNAIVSLSTFKSWPFLYKADQSRLCCQMCNCWLAASFLHPMSTTAGVSEYFSAYSESPFIFPEVLLDHLPFSDWPSVCRSDWVFRAAFM